jgi:phage terminase Nu1 subunit (DNA packaging protein)
MTIVNRGQMAGILGVSEPTLDRMVQRREVIGKKKGNVWEFDTAKVIAHIKKEAGRNTASSRKGSTELRIALADAELKEFKVAELRKTLISVADMAPLFEEQNAIFKSKLTAFPGRLAQRLAVETDPSEVHRLIKAEVAEVLEEVTNEDAKHTHKPVLSKPPRPPDEVDEDDVDEADEDEVPPALTEDGY